MFLEGGGWQIIIDALIKKFQPNLQPENPGIFYEGIVKVHITNKEDRSKMMDIEVEIIIPQMIEPHAYVNTSTSVPNLEENRLRILTGTGLTVGLANTSHMQSMQSSTQSYRG